MSTPVRVSAVNRVKSDIPEHSRELKMMSEIIPKVALQEWMDFS